MTEDACPFCQLAPGRVIDSNELAMAIRDRFPVNEGHTLGGVRLVIPERGNHRQRGRIPKVPEGGGARGP